jgi:hypothetical protein
MFWVNLLQSFWACDQGLHTWAFVNLLLQYLTFFLTHLLEIGPVVCHTLKFAFIVHHLIVTVSGIGSTLRQDALCKQPRRRLLLCCVWGNTVAVARLGLVWNAYTCSRYCRIVCAWVPSAMQIFIAGSRWKWSCNTCPTPNRAWT